MQSPTFTFRQCVCYLRSSEMTSLFACISDLTLFMRMDPQGQSPLQSFTIRFPSFTMQISQYDLQVSEYNLQVSQSKFQNPFSTFRNPIAKFHNPTLTCSPRVSSRSPLNFLMVHCIFLQVPFSACSKFLQGFLQVSFHVSCAFVSRCLDAFLLQFHCGFLLVFLRSFF